MKLFLLLFLFAGFIRSAEASSGKTVYSFKVQTIDGQEKSLADYEGKALLIVNTASKCGYTKQYASLESLYGKYKAQGLEVLGFPANNFMGQEPGTNEEIKKFCSLKYNVTFPMFSKIDVKGNNTHPLYKYLTEESGFNGGISWNFNKFLVGPDGKVAARFDQGTDPMDPKVTAAVESVLSKK